MKILEIESLTKDDFIEIIRSIMQEESSVQKEKETEKKPEYLTRQQTCSLLNITAPTLGSYTKKGILKSYNLGSRVLYKYEEIMDAPVGPA